MPATRSLIILAALAATAVPALAGTRSLIVTPPQMGDASLDPRYILLGASGTKSGVTHFLLPADFKKNSTATLRLTFYNPGSSCFVRFGFTVMER
jgi:hypothetical protein